jgi:hypothetical protein
MNYKDTIIQVEDMKWNMPKLKKHKDGRNDLIIKIPFTEILEEQAKVSFILGIKSLLQFSKENGGKPDFDKLMIDQLIEWGFELGE